LTGAPEIIMAVMSEDVHRSNSAGEVMLGIIIGVVFGMIAVMGLIVWDGVPSHGARSSVAIGIRLQQ
jgi:hypothetical protein